jgi:methyl-accepting chemotaxis protein
MKNRSSLTIFTTILSVLACFGLAFGAGGPESPDPSPFPVNSNTADGFRALENSANGFNSAFGWFSSFTNTGATFFSTGLGAGTLFFNDAADNTAVGTAAMFFNTTGTDNTAVGINALRDNDSGINNNAVGSFALFSNVSGGGNVGIGNATLNNADAFFNTAVGLTAGQNVIAGAENIYIGDTAGTLDFTGAFVGDESGVIRIGSFFSGTTACFINGILANPVPPSIGNTIVTIDPVTGQLGATTDAAGNKVAEQQKKIEEQQASISQLKSEMQTMVAQLREQAAQIQKVSAQLEVRKPATKVVVNKP